MRCATASRRTSTRPSVRRRPVVDVLAADAATIGKPAVNISIFGVFVLITLVITFRASRNNKSAADFYAAGRNISGGQNGLAIAGDYLSAASLLGIAGAIAVYGYYGFLSPTGFRVAWLVPLLLVAELLRNTAGFSMADVLAFRMRQGPVRTAAAISTLVVSLFYLLAQMAGAGGLVTLLLGVSGEAAQALVVVVVGALMIFYVLVGGMRGTTYVQVIKASLLIIGALVMTVWVLAEYGFNLSALIGGAIQSGGQAVAEPGAQYGLTGVTKLDFISLGLALVLGTAGLPHVLMRFYTVPTAKDARRSVVWAIWLIGIFYLFSLVIGYGAGALVGKEEILAAPGAVNAAAPLLAFELGGTALLGIISGVAFATILAVVAGLTIPASASFAHDIYASVIKKGQAPPNSEVKVARITAIVIGAIAIGLGILALQAGLNIAFLAALAFAVAASANLPTILYTLFWRNFTTQGALWSIYGGLISCVTLIIFSPVVSGAPIVEATGKSTSLFQDVDFHWFPLNNPGLVSIPLSFFLGWLGTKLSKERPDVEKYAELEVRSLTGIGAEKAVEH